MENISTGKSIMKSQRAETEITRPNYDTYSSGTITYHFYRVVPCTNQQLVKLRKSKQNETNIYD